MLHPCSALSAESEHAMTSQAISSLLYLPQNPLPPRRSMLACVDAQRSRRRVNLALRRRDKSKQA